MDAKMQTFLEKIKGTAGKTTVVAGKAADTVGKKTTALAQAAKLKLQLYDLHTECEVLYKELGKMMYDIHCGADIENERLDQCIVRIDEKKHCIAKLREQLADCGQAVICPHCGRRCGRNDAFCSGCGGEL